MSGFVVKPSATPGPEGSRILALGCSRAKPYEHPEEFCLAVSS
jgi:hypothetical protein